MQYYTTKSSRPLPVRYVAVRMSTRVQAVMHMHMLRWMSPESIIDGVWDVRTDVWMLGVLLWGECCHRIHAVASIQPVLCGMQRSTVAV